MPLVTVKAIESVFNPANKSSSWIKKITDVMVEVEGEDTSTYHMGGV